MVPKEPTGRKPAREPAGPLFLSIQATWSIKKSTSISQSLLNVSDRRLKKREGQRLDLVRLDLVPGALSSRLRWPAGSGSRDFRT